MVTVLSDGPSLLEHRKAIQGAAVGPVVAVNRAIRYSEDVGIDVWAQADDPTNLWSWADGMRPEHLRYFTIHQNIPIWQDLGVPLRRIYAFEATSMTGFQDDRGMDLLAPTLMHVLAWLLKMGTKEVRLLGCDMSGTGSPDLDWVEEADESFALRWGVERFFLSAAIRHYRARGARIERWAPSKTRAR